MTRQVSNSKPRPWTADELAFVKASAGRISHAQIAAELDRSIGSVKSCVGNHGWHGHHRFTPEQRRLVKEQYGKVPSADLAVAIGRDDVGAVWRLAKKLGVTRKLAPHDGTLTEFVRQKHPLGWCDREIAEAWTAMHPGTHPMERHTISVQRKKLGLGDNQFSEHRRRRVGMKTAEQVAKAGFKSLAQLRLAMWCKWAREQGWPEDLTPPYVKVLNALWDFGPQTRIELARRCGFKRFGPRELLTSNDPHGTITGCLIARGMVIYLGRKVPTGRRGGNLGLYMISPNIQRKKASDGRTTVQDAAVPRRDDGDRAASALAGGHAGGGRGRDQAGGLAGDLRQAS